MSMNDTVADMLTRIRNASAVGKKTVRLPSSKLKNKIAQVLLEEGFIENFQVLEEDSIKYSILNISLKYYNGVPVIENITKISKPGLRVYSSSAELPRIKNGLGIAIVTTPKGVMTDHKARANKLGGEILCIVS